MNKEIKTFSILIIILSTVLYINTLGHKYVLDDFSVIKENFVVKKGVEGIGEIFKTHYRYGYGYVQANLYRPLSLTLFALQWEIAPDQPWLAHLCNILLYAVSCLLLFNFLIKLLGKEYHLFSFFAVLLFAAHPIHTEVVANIKSVDDILALSFSLGSGLLFLQYFENKKKPMLLASMVLLWLAFLSKESTVVFLGIFPLCLWLFRSEGFVSALRKSIWSLLPFLAFLLMRISVLGSLSGDKTIAKIDNLLMAAPNSAVKLATAFKILGLYLYKLIIPHPLMNDYSMQQISLTDFKDWQVWLSFLIYCSLIYLFFKLKANKPIVAFGIAIYLVGISLYSNLFITIGTSFGERLLFIPSIGFCLVLAWGILQLSKLKLTDIRIKNAGTILGITSGILLLYSFKTIDRNKAWKDNFTLYSTDVLNCDKSARCHYYYGLGLMKERAILEKDPNLKNQLLQESVQAFTKSIEILPTYSDAYGQRGLAYYRLNMLDQAVANYLEAIKFNPQNSTALSNLGTLYFQQGKYQEAKTTFEQALRYNPTFVDALANYASTLGTLGDYMGSITYFNKAIALKPNEPSYYQMVGISYQNIGNQQQANFYFNKAKQIQAVQ